MTPPLTRVERRHVDLYEDWCAATGVQPYPASWDTLATFLAASAGAPSTERARAAAIRAAHRAAGLSGPTPRAPSDAMASPRPAVDHLVRALPQWGWPAALFARRDALLLTLWAGTHFSRQ